MKHSGAVQQQNAAHHLPLQLHLPLVQQHVTNPLFTSTLSLLRIEVILCTEPSSWQPLSIHSGPPPSHHISKQATCHEPNNPPRLLLCREQRHN